MVGSAQYQGGGFSGTGKARVMHFETVSAARGTPSLLAMTTLLFVQNRGLYYYDLNSSTADDGTEDTPAIQSGATAGRYLPSTYAIGADEIEQGNALLAASSIRRSSALPFVTQRATTANPAADMATWTVANRFTWTAAQPDHLGGNNAKLATSIPGANSFSCRGDLTGIVIGDEWEIVGYAKPNGSPWLIVQLSFGSVTFNLLTGKTNGGIAGSLDVTQDYVSSSILPAGNGFSQNHDPVQGGSQCRVYLCRDRRKDHWRASVHSHDGVDVF